MKCWNCNSELNGTAFCATCGAAAVRREPATAEGRALRTLLDHYGVEKALNNSTCLVSGLGDLMENAEPLRTRLKLAMDAGLGQMLLTQLRDSGAAPDADFTAKAIRLIADKAGLSDGAAAEVMGYIDDMLGWHGEPISQPAEIPSSAAASLQAASTAADAPVSAAAAPAPMAVPQDPGKQFAIKYFTFIGTVGLIIYQLALEFSTWEIALGWLLPGSVNSYLLKNQGLSIMLTSALCILPLVLALGVPLLLRKGEKKEATVCAAILTLLMVVMVVTLSFGLGALLGVFELPMVLFALVLLRCTVKGGADKRMENLLWLLSVVCLAAFVALSFGFMGNLTAQRLARPIRWSVKAWMNANWFNLIFMGGATWYKDLSGPLSAFFPLTRALLVALTALQLRKLRKQ